MSKRKFTKLKVYLMERGITQRDVQEQTSLSSGAVNRLINTGEANKATIKLICLTFDIPEKEMDALLKEYKNPEKEAEVVEAKKAKTKKVKKVKKAKPAKKSKKAKKAKSVKKVVAKKAVAKKPAVKKAETEIVEAEKVEAIPVDTATDVNTEAK